MNDKELTEAMLEAVKRVEQQGLSPNLTIYHDDYGLVMEDGELTEAGKVWIEDLKNVLSSGENK